MGIFEAVRTCLFSKYLDFRGRASRAEYWWFVVFGVSVNVAAAVAGIRPLSYLVTALLVVPQMAVTVRRLHDTDRSGWWLLLSAPNWLDFILEDQADSVGWFGGFGFFLVGAIASLVLFWFMVQKGDAGENRYGPDPAPDTVLGLSRSGGPPSRNRD